MGEARVTGTTVADVVKAAYVDFRWQLSAKGLMIHRGSYDPAPAVHSLDEFWARVQIPEWMHHTPAGEQENAVRTILEGEERAGNTAEILDGANLVDEDPPWWRLPAGYTAESFRALLLNTGVEVDMLHEEITAKLRSLLHDYSRDSIGYRNTIIGLAKSLETLRVISSAHKVAERYYSCLDGSDPLLAFEYHKQAECILAEKRLK